MNKTIMALVPHPDDAEWYAGGLLAMLNKNVAFIAQDAEIGKQIDVKFAEAYRYERFHPLVESIIKKG